MIYTLTLNPAIDYVVNVENYISGAVNRTFGEKLLAGGKGINVSTVLKNLGAETIAMGFLAGFTGELIKKMLDSDGIPNDFIFAENGCSRINVKIKAGEETEINGRGADISENDISELFRRLDMIKNGDILVLAGSVPKNISTDIYCEIMGKTAEKNILTVVDATGDLLLKTLKYRPFLIKPNNFELEEICGHSLKNDEETVIEMRNLQKLGAKNVLVSMAENGALLLTENGEIFRSEAVKGNVVNSTGAGDSMVAGFLAGWTKKQDFKYALEMGISAGSASAFSENLASKEEIEAVYELLLKKGAN